MLVVVVVLGLPARKAIEHDDEDEKETAGFFLLVLVVVVVLGLLARKAIEHDDEDDDEKRLREDAGITPLAGPFLPVIKTKGLRHDGGS